MAVNCSRKTVVAAAFAGSATVDSLLGPSCGKGTEAQFCFYLVSDSDVAIQQTRIGDWIDPIGTIWIVWGGCYLLVSDSVVAIQQTRFGDWIDLIGTISIDCGGCYHFYFGF